MDKHGNLIAEEGCTRCSCGAKYWERDVCVSCGAPVTRAWTVVTRLKGARFYRPVAGLPTDLDWDGARNAADTVAGLLRGVHDDALIWYVPRVSTWPEDRNNVLEDSGKRVPIRWDAEPTVTCP